MPYGSGPTTDFRLRVAMGLVDGYAAVNKFGHNPEVLTGTDPEDIWAGGGMYAFYPTTAQTVQAVSDSAEDGVGGTGALAIQVYGLGTDWTLQDETVVMDGVTPVVLQNQYIRMFRTVVLTAGTNDTNVGNILIGVAGGDVGIYVAADDGQTQQGIYTVPAGYTAFFLKGYTAISKGGGSQAVAAQFKWRARPNNGTNGAWATKGQIECVSSGSGTWQYEYGVPSGPIPEKTDVRLECTEVTATVGVVGGFDLMLVRNDLVGA